jgi:parallel beta-helix repeat protein
VGIWKSNPVVIRNCILTDNGQNGLLIAGVKNGLVTGGQWLRNNTLFPKYYNHGVEAVSKVASCEDTIIEGIESAYNRGFGMWVDGPLNRRITLRNNRIHRNGVPGAFTSGIRVEISYLVDVYNNVIYRNDSGISIDTSIGCRVFNNTIAYHGSEGIYCAGIRNQWDTIDPDAVMRNYGNELYNNILAFNQQGSNKRGYIVSYNVPNPSFNPPEFPSTNGVVPFAQNFSNNNLFFKRSGGDANFFGLHTDSPWANVTYTSLTAWQSAAAAQGWDTQSKWGQDPLFVNAAADDFRIQSGSPAINSGIVRPGAPAASLADFFGVPRAVGEIDLGAYQYVSEVVQSATGDAYVENGGNAGVNFGGAVRLNAELKASTIRKTYLSFSLFASSRPIANASLQLIVNAPGAATFQVYGLNNGASGDGGWSEQALTWSNAPANGGGNSPDSNATLLGSFAIPSGVTTGTPIEFTSPQLQTFLNSDTNNTVTLIVIRTTNSTSLNNTFHSKENLLGLAGPTLTTR